jgi:hypothetical protein
VEILPRDEIGGGGVRQGAIFQGFEHRGPRPPRDFRSVRALPVPSCFFQIKVMEASFKVPAP